MQQLLLHSLLERQTAWHEPSSVTQTAPSAPMPFPLWQHSLVVAHPPPGATHVPPPLLVPPLLVPPLLVPPLLVPPLLVPPLLVPLDPHPVVRGVHEDGSGFAMSPHLVSAV